jgi:hypothetical protein
VIAVVERAQRRRVSRFNQLEFTLRSALTIFAARSWTENVRREGLLNASARKI